MSDDFDLTPATTKREKEKKRGSGANWGILAIVVMVLAKFKFLLLGLTKIKTVLSMLVFFGVYWQQHGWLWALGFVLSIYIHEMGHVAALRSYGIDATAPMFIPFVGAFVRVNQAFDNVIQDARVGLAGPFWGLGATVATYGAYYYFHEPVLLAIAHTSAFINLFNLIPFWQLDGGRGFRSLDRPQRWLAFGTIGLALFVSHQHFLLVLLGFALYQCLRKDVAPEPDGTGLFQYAFLVMTLSVLCMTDLPGMSQP